MAWAFVEALGTANSKSSSTTLVVTITGAAAVGNQVIVFVGGLTQSTDIQTVTDSRSNSYTRLGGASYDLGIGRLAAFISTLTTALQVGDTITATWAAAVSTRIMCASEWSGGSATLTGGTPTTAENAASTTMTVGPNASNVAVDDLVIAFFMASNATDVWMPAAGATWTGGQAPTTGFTGTNRSGFEEWKIAASATTFTATATQGGSRANDGILLALAPAVVAPVEKASSDTGAGAEATTALGAAASSADTGAGAEATDGLAAMLASAETGTGAEVTDSLTAAVSIASSDSGSGLDATLALDQTTPPAPPAGLGGGGDAWAATGTHVSGRPAYSRPAPSMPRGLEMPAPRPTRRERAAALRARRAREQAVRLSEPRLPAMRIPAGAPARYRDVRSQDVGGAVEETYDLLETTRRRPPRHPLEREIEDLELLAIL